MKDIRSWATPLTIGSFFLTAITGVMMFFKVQYGIITPVHEWLSLVFVIGSILHVKVNWKVFASYFSKIPGRQIIAAFAVIIIVTLIPFGSSGHKSPFMTIGKIVQNVPLETLASAMERKPADLAEQIKAKGLTLSGNERTIADIAASNGVDSMHVLRIVLD